MAKVLLDIGAHLGETLSVALDPRWAFDEIHCFEPAPSCWPELERLADDRVTVHRFGLWDRDATLRLYNPGTIGASVHTGKDPALDSAEIEVRDAGRWFADNVSPDDHVIAKINCEGAEVEILERLLDTGELAKVDELLIHFDVRKIAGLEGAEARLRDRLDRSGVSYRPAEQLFFGRNTEEKTANWLAWYHAPAWRRPQYSLLRRLEFAARVWLYERRRPAHR